MTTPTGKLAWGQAASYDAVDDRSVITAVTRGRIGLMRPVEVAAGTGLQVIIRAGWLGVAPCDDLTSAVVGSREEQFVQANPGPASGSREDVVWCDTSPDEGFWELSVITAAEAAGRPGIPLVYITVPQNANLATQMTFRPVDASIERRLLSHTTIPGIADNSRDYTATGWGQAVGRGVTSDPVQVHPGQWYRVTYVAPMCSMITGGGSLEGRIGIGERTEGQDPGLTQMRRAGVICWARAGVPVISVQYYVFRHTFAAAWRIFEGRIWLNGTGVIRPAGYTDLGPDGQTLTVEDIGS